MADSICLDAALQRDSDFESQQTGRFGRWRHPRTRPL